MRVAVNVEQLLYSSPGGIGRYTARLVTLLPDLYPADELVPFSAWHGQAACRAAWHHFGLSEEHRLVRIPLPRPALYECWHRLGLPPIGWSSPRTRHVDLIHGPSVAVPPKGRSRLVVTVHDAAPLLYPEAFSPHGLRFHLAGLTAAARRADVVITGTHAAADEIAQLTRIDADRIRVVPYGVDAARADPADIERARLSFGLDEPYVLWVGSMEPRKNVRTLLAAVARLQRGTGAGRAGRAPLLVLVGYAGWRNDAAIDPEDRLVLGERVRDLGRVSDEELRSLYAGAAVFAFPSLHEGFGLPVIEAMAAGTPVICSDIPPLREIGGSVPIFVAPRDVEAWAGTLADLLADGTQRRRMGEQGPPVAAGFSWDRCVRSTHDVYLEAIG